MAEHDESTDKRDEQAERTEQPVEPVPESPAEPSVAPSAEREPEASSEAAAEAEETPSAAPPEQEAAASPEPEAAASPEPDAAAPAEPEGAAAAAVAAEQPQPKRKRKRLPRALRPARTRPRREQASARKPIVRLEQPERPRGRSQERQGTVLSAGMDKTIVVKVDVIKAHRKYKKVVKRSTKLHAHDEGNTAKVGDVVRVVETRPLSKTKRWRLAEIVEVAK